MEDTAKYLIHADFLADGVVERSDVVGAVFGQTEGLLGDDLDIRDLQQSSKLGRIDVEVRHESGQSVGEITIASSLDRVETATLAAALEAIERIGPSHAAVEVSRIEDVRAAKRRAVVDRAKELLATAFDDAVMDSDAILDEVRESIRVEDITEYAGYPAGPNVASSDAIIVVEGRADVLTLLKYGIKNAIAVEGTNVPDEVVELMEGKTVTAFLDGDRGGDLIRRELTQVGDLDYVAVAPEGSSVEDLSRADVDIALRNKVRADQFDEADVETAATDGSATPAPPVDDSPSPPDTSDTPDTAETPAEPSPGGAGASEPTADEQVSTSTTGKTETDSTESGADTSPQGETAQAQAPQTLDATLADHVEGVVGSGQARFLDDALDVLETVDAEEAFDALEAADSVPRVVVVDDAVSQRIVDVAAQRGVGEVIGTERGSFVKQPTSVRVRTADEVVE